MKASHHPADDDETPFRDRGPVTAELAEEVLGGGDIELLGRMPWSSNMTFLADVCLGDQLLQGIYKPHKGERPLWDFPSGLYKREVAAYRLAKALGWEIIPPTVLRDGPVGPGSLQLFVPCDFSVHYFHMLEDERHHHTLQRFAAFDIAANSTDRKGGHLLLDRHDGIWGIDNGLTFHAEFKLRTVIWDFGGDDIPADIVADLQALLETGLPDDLCELLDPHELEALKKRMRGLVRDGCFPVDHSGHRYPWPLV